MTTLVVLADDLSGAAETAAALGVERDPRLFLWPDVPSDPTPHPVVLDLDSRHLPSAEATARITKAMSALVGTPATLVFTKIDSLLRGNIAPQVDALTSPDALVVLTPALPEQGRTVVGGVVLEHGTPLEHTDLWALEPASPPPTVAAALEGLPTRAIGLAEVRSDALPETLSETVGAVAVCDAETSADLAAVVAAGLRATPHPRFAGSSALARALGATLLTTDASPSAPRSRVARGGVLYVVGTGSPDAGAQAAHLAARTGLAQYEIAPGKLAACSPDEALAQEIAAQLGERSVMIRVSPERVPSATASDVAAGLARLVAATLASAPGWPVRLMLTGGQTARAVLEALDRRRLSLLEEIHPGAVLLTTDDGWLIATRPGTHGDVDSLWAIHQAMYGLTPTTNSTTDHEERIHVH